MAMDGEMPKPEGAGQSIEATLVNANDALTQVMEVMAEQGAPREAIAPFAKVLSDFRTNVQTISGEAPAGQRKAGDTTRDPMESNGSVPAQFQS
jgi:hypothetical protein